MAAALKQEAAIILLSFVLILLINLDPAKGKCPKLETLLHNFNPTYFLDKGETIEAWAKLIPEPWEDNRLIGSLSNTEYLTFNLTSSETFSELQAIGVISRNVTVSIGEKEKHRKTNTRQSETEGDVLFRIEAFSEDQTCAKLKAETNVTIGCPLTRHIIPRGKPVRCDGFKNYSFVIERYQQKDLFLANRQVLDKTVEYDLSKLGCPFSVQSNEPFKPILDLYDGEIFVKEVDVNYVMWEQHGRKGYKYSTTMRKAGCINEAQSWEKMINTVKAENMESTWTKENYQSCFEESPQGPGLSSTVNLDQPYEILNSSTAASHIVWNDVGTFVFLVKVIDPEFSFCNLTVQFAVQVHGVRSVMEEIPTFVVLGSSCLTITILLLSAYYTAVLCSN